MAVVLAVGLSACSTGSLKKFNEDAALPVDLPSEMKEKFEIKEIAEPAATGATVQPASGNLSDVQKVPQVATAETTKAAATPAGTKISSKKKSTQKPSLAKDSSEEAEEAPFIIPNRRPSVDPIWLGEEHVFDITYFGMGAGEFKLRVEPYKVINERKVYHVRGEAKSSSVFNLFYRVNDSLETFFDYEGLFSHRFHLVLDESKQTRDSLELYDSEKKETYYWNRWNHYKKGYTETKKFSPIPAFAQDSLSALYYLRTLPLKDGAVYTFPVVSEGKHWEAVVTVIGREQMETPMGRVRTIKVKPETKFKGVLQKKGDSYIWLTDDERRYVVRIEAKVKIGTVVGDLKRIEPGIRPFNRTAAGK